MMFAEQQKKRSFAPQYINQILLTLTNNLTNRRINTILFTYQLHGLWRKNTYAQ